MCNGSDDAVLSDIPVGREATWRLLCTFAGCSQAANHEPAESGVQSRSALLGV